MTTWALRCIRCAHWVEAIFRSREMDLYVPESRLVRVPHFSFFREEVSGCVDSVISIFTVELVE